MQVNNLLCLLQKLHKIGTKILVKIFTILVNICLISLKQFDVTIIFLDFSVNRERLKIDFI